MKNLFFYSLLFVFAQSYAQEMPMSSANDKFSSYELFKDNRALSSVSFSSSWGDLQGFVGGINARQMFAVGNGRLFLGGQGEYSASGKFYNNLSVGVVGRYYVFNTSRWSAFAQSSLNAGRTNFNNYRAGFWGGGFGGGITPYIEAATTNFMMMDAGVGLQYRVTKRLALEMLVDKPLFVNQRNVRVTSQYFAHYGIITPPQSPQLKLGANMFFGK